MEFNNIPVTDIVIPVYHVSESWLRCIRSIAEYTALSAHRLIFVYDRKNEQSVMSALKEISQNPVIKIYYDKSKGWVSGVNQGLKSSKNDVVLLGPDTIVTKNWIHKLRKCAYMDEATATVVPLSNTTGRYFSDEQNSDYMIPEDCGLHKYAEEVERTSLGLYPKIQTGESSCIYIKRVVIDELGGLDANGFRRLDGAVKDLCCKSLEYGYCHLLCDNTLVYSLDGGSAEPEPEDDIAAENEILTSRYPKLTGKNAHACYNRRALKKIFENHRLYRELSLYNGRKNILYFLLADFRDDASNNIGGTQFHVKDMVCLMREEYNVFVAARDQDYLRVTAYIGPRRISFMFHIGKTPPYNLFHDKRQSQMYQCILKAFQIDLVHVQHTMWLSLDIYRKAQELGIPLVFTVHDYYYICPTLKVMDLKGEVCIGEAVSPGCADCLESIKGVYSGLDYIEKWRREHGQALKMCDKVIFPSESAADNYARYYPCVRDKTQIIPHGIDVEGMLKSSKGKERVLSRDKLRVAFVGGISEVKGGKLIYDLITRASRDQYKWFIFGGIGYEELYYLKQKNLVKTGWYERKELCGLLEENNIDIVCILSKIPETFCYTLSESIVCNVPVIVTDIGALGERMRKMDCGWLVPKDISCEDLLDLLKHIKENPREYEEKYHQIKKIESRSTAQMGLEYKEIYEKTMARLERKYPFQAEVILEGYQLTSGKDTAPPAGEPAVNEGGRSMQELLRAQKELEEIKESLSFRLVSAMRNSRFPMKQKVKKMLIRMRRSR